jgi:multidrug efflux system outer membrane protein
MKLLKQAVGSFPYASKARATSVPCAGRCGTGTARCAGACPARCAGTYTTRGFGAYTTLRSGAYTALCVAGLLLGGCANLSAPDDQAAYEAAMAAPLPAGWSSAADNAMFRPEWLGFDASGELRVLLDEAFAHNPDLRAAGTRVEQARLQTQLAGAALLPSVDTAGKWSNSLISADALNLSGVGAVAGWEIDLWGATHAGLKASDARYRSVEADYVYARAALGAATAKAWLLNLQAARQLELLAAIERSSLRQRDIVQARAGLGTVSGIDSAQAQAAADAVHEQWLAAVQARQAAQRALELVLGRYPAARIELAGEASSLLATQLPAVPAGVPLDVLARRPDLIASRKAFEATFFGAQQAKAARLPNLTLTAGAAYLDTSAAIFQGKLDSAVFPIGARLSWPLFDGGLRQTQFEIATPQQSAAAAKYASDIQRALGEVENALAAERQLTQRGAVLVSQAQQTGRAAGLMQVRQELGQVDAYAVLDKQIAAYRSQTALLQLEAARLAARIDLHLALGGTFFNEGSANAVRDEELALR